MKNQRVPFVLLKIFIFLMCFIKTGDTLHCYSCQTRIDKESCCNDPPDVLLLVDNIVDCHEDTHACIKLKNETHIERRCNLKAYGLLDACNKYTGFEGHFWKKCNLCETDLCNTNTRIFSNNFVYFLTFCVTLFLDNNIF